MSEKRGKSAEKRKGTSPKEELGPERKKKTLETDNRPLCKYGELCYQKNAPHLAKFRHPHKEKTDEQKNKMKPAIESVSFEEGRHPQNAFDEVHGEEETSEKLGRLVTEVSSPELKEEDLPPSPSDVRQNIKQKFLFEMPEDFYQLWEFCKSTFSDNPCGALKDILGIKLVGPYQLLEGNQKCSKKQSDFLNEWRFYYDPPEFQTIAIGNATDGFHLGYFRDDPKELPSFVGSNTESKGCTINPLSDNIFGALCQMISEKLKKTDPFQKANLTAFRTRLTEWAAEHDIPVQSAKSEQKIKERKRKVVAKTFYGCGMVVPYDKKTQVGYREIPESDASLKKILKRIVDSKDSVERDKHFDPLQELVNNVQYANDEMDWGMGLELGWDLLAFGGEALHSTISHLLGVAYELLERQPFAIILKAHFINRRHLSNIYTI